MDGDEVASDCPPEETAERLQAGLRSCRALVDTYRAMLVGDGPAADGTLSPEDSEPMKVDDPA